VSEMVERAAKELCKHYRGTAHRWREFEEDVQIVIGAMMEPTPKMWDARHGEGDPPIDRGQKGGSPLDDWQAMIDAAVGPPSRC
jgi:hypothetical protein